MGLQVILIKTPGNLLTGKLREILEMEVDYNFKATFVMNKLLIPRGDISSLILEEAFGSRKDHRSIEVSLCRMFWGVDSEN